MQLLLVVLLTLGLVACDKESSDGTKDHARAQREAERDVENDNLAQKAEKMEKDLHRRYRFYKGISNDYIGSFKINDSNYKMKMTFIPTLHVIDSGRVRTLEEIEADLNNLFLNAQVVIWDEPNNIGTAGCVFETVRPDIVFGQLQLIANECANRFAITLTVPNTDKKDRSKTGELLAAALLDGQEDDIEYLHSEVHSKFNPNGYDVLLKRVK